MIKENSTPSLFGCVPPLDDDEAEGRLSELINLGIVEGIVGSLWKNESQLRIAFIACGFFFAEKKKPYINAVSKTSFIEVECQRNGSEFLLIVNCFGEYARILNCIQTGKAKVEPDEPETPKPFLVPLEEWLQEKK